MAPASPVASSRNASDSPTPRPPATSPAPPDLTHAQVNLELNRLAGMRRIDEATVEQLQSRLEHATRWRWRLAR